MDKCTDRLDIATTRIKDVNFRNVSRFAGLDSETDDLHAAWAKFGSPKFDPSDPEFVKYPGKQACALGHYNIWIDIIQKNIPYAVVFEDDVEFHKEFKNLAPIYWLNTPRDFDILYFGAQIESPHITKDDHIVVAPVFCTHAYVITHAGAKKLYDICINDPRGTRTIDCMIIDKMHHALATNGNECAFMWYAWNATGFQDENRFKRKDWAKRNMGLVFQDAELGTFVRPW
jgi:GR25 family glycosyltransferase involved in LPS biosynthesis